MSPPGWVPLPRETVLLTGVCEIAGAVALLTTRLRYAARVMLALYAVCVFPSVYGYGGTYDKSTISKTARELVTIEYNIER